MALVTAGSMDHSLSEAPTRRELRQPPVERDVLAVVRLSE